ncbi:MAG: YbjN domain-containing protein [Pseudomonadota bacterium]
MKAQIAGLVLGLCASSPLAAQQMLFPSVDTVRSHAAARGPTELIMPSADYPDPYIEAQAQGYYYLAILVGCEGMVGCDQVEFSASFTTDDPSLRFANSWNSENRIGTAYIEAGTEDEILLSYTIVIDPGISVGAFTETLDIWVDTMDAFSNQLYGYDQGSRGGGSSGGAVSGK